MAGDRTATRITAKLVTAKLIPMKPGILVVARIFPPTLAELERDYAVHNYWEAADKDALVKKVACNVRGLVTTGLMGCDRARMEALPGLEIIASFGTPNGTVDLAAARERGIIVANTPDRIQELVAELAIGLAIAVMRRVCETDRFVRAGRWAAESPPMGTGLLGKTCGIVAMGRIGRGTARRAEAFGMSVCWHGPRPKDDVPYPYYPDLAEMARRSDCLIVTCPHLPETTGLVSARVLEALGPKGFLVNVARGPVVDERALVAALKERRIAGAGLDVYWDEPRVPAALLPFENVVMTPHLGSATLDVREERGRKLLANLKAHFSGRPVPYPLAQRVG
ncbi:MAG: 2-hydroxyacid dehydrogenase [Burkholderiales bacterium]|nr:2-hydroxyacid dehydrogenase [Burkholderiales bacterium]